MKRSCEDKKNRLAYALQSEKGKKEENKKTDTVQRVNAMDPQLADTILHFNEGQMYQMWFDRFGERG